MNGEVPPPEALLLYPPPARTLSAADIHSDLKLPEGEPGGAPYTVINAVSTLDGRAATGGKSSPLGGSADRLVMRNIRCAADAVLAGAGTLRSENLDLGVPDGLVERRRANGLSEQPLQVVLKGQSPLPENRRLYEAAGERLLILATEITHLGPARALGRASTREVAATTASGLPEAESVLALLGREFGVRRLLVEGGAAVNRSFLSSGLVSELFLTLAPRVTGEAGAPHIVSDGPPLSAVTREWRLMSTHTDAEGVLYLRYRSQRVRDSATRAGERDG